MPQADPLFPLTDASRTAFELVSEVVFAAGRQAPEGASLMDFLEYSPALLCRHVHAAIIEEWGGPDPPDYSISTWRRGERAGRKVIAEHGHMVRPY